jgi:hypothetical protein
MLVSSTHGTGEYSMELELILSALLAIGLGFVVYLVRRHYAQPGAVSVAPVAAKRLLSDGSANALLPALQAAPPKAQSTFAPALKSAPSNVQAAAAKPVVPVPRVPAAKKRARPVESEDFEWEGPISIHGPASSAPAASGTVPTHGADLIMRRKIRDRYIAARFPCTAQSSADLENVGRVIKAARLFFEEDQPDRAMELLELAAEQSPGDESLDLAQLEIAFLMRDAETYGALALSFRHNRPASNAWDEIARLGRIIAPHKAVFGAPIGTSASAHYGPWPEMPNWIQASWDLTGEILAADFHRAMSVRAQAFDAGPLHAAA